MPAPKSELEWESVGDSSTVVTDLKNLLTDIVSERVGLLASIINDAAQASIDQTKENEKTKKRKEQCIAKSNKMLRRAGLDLVL